MFECTVEDHFSAAHHLLHYEGPCARPHGHNYHVMVGVQSQTLDAVNIAVDFRALKKALAEVIEPLDHQDLNTLPMFEGLSPSAEIIARYVYRQLKGIFPEVAKVQIYETANQCVTYWE